MPGVKSAKCDYATKSATVVLEDGVEVDDQALTAALTEAGFGGSVAK